MNGLSCPVLNLCGTYIESNCFFLTGSNPSFQTVDSLLDFLPPLYEGMLQPCCLLVSLVRHKAGNVHLFTFLLEGVQLSFRTSGNISVGI